MFRCNLISNKSRFHVNQHLAKASYSIATVMTIWTLERRRVVVFYSSGWTLYISTFVVMFETDKNHTKSWQRNYFSYNGESSLFYDFFSERFHCVDIHHFIASENIYEFFFASFVRLKDVNLQINFLNIQHMFFYIPKVVEILYCVNRL